MTFLPPLAGVFRVHILAPHQAALAAAALALAAVLRAWYLAKGCADLQRLRVQWPDLQRFRVSSPIKSWSWERRRVRPAAKLSDDLELFDRGSVL